MGTISTNIGLVSGIDTGALIDQLIAIESRPRQLVERRVAVLQSQKAAFLDVSAQLLALEGASKTLGDPGLFRTKSASSSNESILIATADKSAAIASYSFTVDRLVSTHQLLSRGLADRDTSTFGAGVLRFEDYRARLDADVSLAELNGSTGVKRGEIRITDRSGAAAYVDLTRAVTLQDAIDAINNTVEIDVTASLAGGSIVLTDNTGQTAGNLIVQEVGATSTTAANLGILGSVASSTITGTQINAMGGSTLLGHVNDHNGVRRAGTGLDDFAITDGGGTYNVSLAGVQNIQGVIDAIATASGGAVTASIAPGGVSLQLAGSGTVSVAAMNGSGAASDLGILGSGSGTLAGSRIVADLGSKLLKNLNGGQGVNTAGTPEALSGTTALTALLGGAGITTNGDDASPDIRVQDRKGDEYLVELDGLNTVQELLDAFNAATGGEVTLAIDGDTLVATNNTSGGADFQIADANGATVATELGITIDSPNPGGPDAVTGGDLNPTAASSFVITDRSGASATINLSGAESISDVIDLINAAAVGVIASLNAAGNGLRLTDTTGSTAGNLIVQENGGSTAAQLGLLTTAAGVDEDHVDGFDTDFKYISESTRTETLNGGRGVARGKFTIQDSNGVSSEVDLTQGNEVTLADIISEINSRPTAIVASINATGDGITLTDTGSGTVKMKVTEAGSTTAKDLGILGEDTDGDHVIMGSFERTVQIASTDTLDSIVTKINEAGVGVQASIINDGSGVNAYRLNLTSERSGAAGRVLFDDGGLGFESSTLVEGRDAVVLFGSSDPTQALLITSKSNTLANTIQGVTIDLKGTSSQPVQVAVTRDDEAVVTAASAMVDAYNGVLDAIDKYDKYDAETETRGLLLGDSTLSIIRRRLQTIVNSRQAGVGGQYEFLTQVGMTVRDGARLRFDEAKFRETLANDPDSVRSLFTATTTTTLNSSVELPPGVSIPTGGQVIEPVGFGQKLLELVKGITDSVSGTLKLKTNSIDSLIEQSNRRITQLNAILASKRQRLENQFAAMEQALARLQDQQGSLASLQNLAANPSQG